MSIVAPPPRNELELLIREAPGDPGRLRQRRRDARRASDVWTARAIRVHGRRVSIRERRDTGLHQQWKTVTLHVA